jgi:glycosyltransferase involved in cell wall biosynthesis
MTRPRVFVVNSANPEVDRLASGLSEQGHLRTFVRRYANMGRPWEKFIEKLPAVNRRYSNTMGRRTLLPALRDSDVVDAGIFYDFLAAIALRSSGRIGPRVSEMLLRRRSRSIARAARSIAGDANLVVGNYGVSLELFEQVARMGGRAILNYPNVHHGFQHKFLTEEAEREPHFASTFSTEITAMASIYDRECSLADTILVGSSFVRRSFEQEGLGSRNIVVIPYGCDVSMFSPDNARKPSDRFRALFVGQLTQRKGLSYLLRAYEAFRGPQTELLLAGRSVGDPAALKPYAHLFTYLGNMPHKKLPELYRQVEVFVFPTLLEGMPLVVLEAMASGLPVITTSHGPGDIVRDGIDGFVVPIRDQAAIANRLEILRSNSELRMAMGQAARARAMEYTWQRYCDSALKTVLNPGWAMA